MEILKKLFRHLVISPKKIKFFASFQQQQLYNLDQDQAKITSIIHLSFN